MRNRFCSLLTVLLLAVASTSAQQCTAARVRRSWTALSPADRQLYKDAIAAAMDSGAYIKFVEIHTEMMSEMEAHRQCMFIYWHRAFLAAFENMLRGQAPRFACVTVPYWDWTTDYSKYASGSCTNILSCSPALSFLGDRAPVNRGWRNVAINGESIGGYCEADAPMNRFCQNSQTSGTRCARCLPREDWTQVAFPASASYASVRSQIIGSSNIGELATALEQGVHNNMHAELGSTMATYESPADPVFWSHHATVDLLHSIFHKCKVGEQRMTFDEKAASVDWTSCERRNGGSFKPTDVITMRTAYMGRNPQSATRDAKIGRFVSAVPQQFAALVDIRDLGASSYSYELQGLLGSLFTDCGNSAGAASTSANPRGLREGSGSGLGGDGNSTVVPPQTTGPPAPAPPSISSMVTTSTEPAAQKTSGWVNSTDKVVRRRGGNAVLEAEKMACLFQDECLGGVTTYTPEFKRRFGITGEPRCKQIVDRLRRRADSLRVTEWKAQMMQTFGCPKPKADQAVAQNSVAQKAPESVAPSPAPVVADEAKSLTPCPDAAKAIALTNARAVAYAYGDNKETLPSPPVSVPPVAMVSPAATVSAGNADANANFVRQRIA